MAMYAVTATNNGYLVHHTYQQARCETHAIDIVKTYYIPATVKFDAIKAVPAIAYKHADPTEGARWIFDEDDLRDIEREDPSLITRM